MSAKLFVICSVLAAAAGCEGVNELASATQGAAPHAVEPDVTSPPDRRTIEAELTDAPRVPREIYRDKPAHVVVNLEVTEVEREIAPGVRYVMWTFGGQVPGKFIRVRQGDVVELRLQNHPSSKLPHNIDLHAVTGTGGGAEGTFTAPGKQTQITFRALNPGLYVYHCATAPVPMHVANGMYGLILVEPPRQGPNKLGWADVEYYVMQGELYTSGAYHAQGLQAFDLQKGIDEKPTYVLFNGAEGALVGPKALRAKVGQTVRIYVGNGGPNLISSFHVIGEIFDRVYTEGGTRVQENVQTTLIPAGGAAIVEFKVDVPGTYALVDHSLFRAFNKGAVGQLIVEGTSGNDVYSGQQAELAYTPAARTGAASGAALAAQTPGELGKATFGRMCAGCHQSEGQGMPGAFPPLAKSDYLASTPKDTLIGHLVNGLQGPIVVNGTTYDSVMPPMGFLTDDEVASVLTFVRSSWGNTLDGVKPADVAAVRARMAVQP
ncbi:MAG TPA: copper-containing nitrite reductase [Kofleriaceae bacterium]|nr:copper-containing nitrite reductase [Kofleriaceae bacterium]